MLPRFTRAILLYCRILSLMTFSCLFSKASKEVRCFLLFSYLYLYPILFLFNEDLLFFFVFYQVFTNIKMKLGRVVGNVGDYASASLYGDSTEYSHQVIARYKYVCFFQAADSV